MSLASSLEVTIDEDVVTFLFTVTNEGSDPVTLEFSSSHVADVAVFEDDTEVWRWSEGRMFTQALESETLAPGESLSHTGAWDDREPGSYTAVGTLEATNYDAEAEATFQR